MSDALERFYDGLDNNVVLRDANNRPSVFVKHHKVSSNTFDPSATFTVGGVEYPCLPDHTHPAFIVNGVEDPALLIGKYQSVELTPKGTQYSLPNAVPAPVYNYATNLSAMRAFGQNVSGMTIADHGLMVLMAHKNKWITYGNNRGGNDYRDGNSSPAWSSSSSTAYSVGVTVIFRGYLYECIKEHTSSSSTSPLIDREHWKKLRKTGGTPVAERIGSSDASSAKTVLTGSGPANWYFGHDLANEADIGGNGDAWLYGALIRYGELWILPNNDAADPNADLSTSSDQWRAIKPCEPTESNGYTNYMLVSTGGTDTIHFVYTNKLMITDRELTSTEQSAGEKTAYFKDLTFEPSSVNLTNYGIPTILYELGLYPLPGTTVDGRMDIGFSSSYICLSFGRNFTQGAIQGIASYRCMSTSSSDIGASDRIYFSTRPRARVLA